MLSAYYNSLSPSDKISYAAKLALVNGIRLNDPYALDAGEWINDEKKWPRLQWPDIHSYPIETPSLYSQESLKSYKTLDAYSYITDNHVQDILLHDYNIENFVALKTEVLPSQRQGKRMEMYKVWVILNKKNNCILTTNCTWVCNLE